LEEEECDERHVDDDVLGYPLGAAGLLGMIAKDKT